MSRMTDYIRRAFATKDGATLDKLIADAEAEEKNGGNGGEEEPDGDEGTHIHLHMGEKDAKPGAAKGTKDNDDPKTEERLKAVEDGIIGLGKGMRRVMDHLGVKSADGELPPGLKAAIEKKKEGEGGGDDDDKPNGDGKPKTGDEEGVEAGAQSAEKLTAAEPDLMEADPSLKTGRSMMGDAAYTQHVTTLMPKLLQDMKARAEILMPGIHMPTMDAKPGKQTQDAICTYRRNALVQAAATEKGAKAIGSYTADAIKTMSCDAVRMLFNDASQRMHDANNGAYAHNPDAYRMPNTEMASYRGAQAQRLGAINKANQDFWARQTGRPN